MGCLLPMVWILIVSWSHIMPAKAVGPPGGIGHIKSGRSVLGI